MAQPALIDNPVFTYKDYLSWPAEERWELIDGVPWNMSPAPGTTHQRMVRELAVALYGALAASSCELFLAPFDVRLPETSTDQVEDETILTVVQPDLAIICDKGKIDSKGCLGPPDVMIEVLSPSSAYRDETDKLHLYESQGVREYWIVNPDGGYIMVYTLNGKEYGKPEYLWKKDRLISKVIDGIALDLEALFARIVPSG
ncbi:MAG: Uma2 family endonuclease [Candidatus Electrothrix aestuarii]|uniref:Uma2 family endonuclease n=1 Tax=Candidatus Electrothrix aestuarii TaxID=3062594 RepID=A0AAU8LT66_9BACT|nr:Uma2 family endonuclease [Candidatus Electrothrix aestuarii]